jgi:hypothetical protein
MSTKKKDRDEKISELKGIQKEERDGRRAFNYDVTYDIVPRPTSTNRLTGAS